MHSPVRKFKGFYGTLSFNIAINIVFIMLYLKVEGYSLSQIGLINSLNMGISIVGQLFWGYISDLKGTIKRLLMLNVAVLSALSLLVMLVSGGNLMIVVLAVFSFFQAPLMFFTEMWVLQSDEEISKHYGGIRAFASAGWAICALIMGEVINKLGWKSMFIMYSLIALLILFMAKSMKDIEVSHKDEAQEKVNPLILFKDVKYLIVVLIAVFMNLGQQVFLFYGLIIENFGGTSTHLGIGTFLMAMSELPLFFMANRVMEKHKLTSIAMFTAIAYLLRMVLHFAATSYIHVIILGILQAVTFPFLDIIRKYMILKTAPAKLQNTAQSFCLSLSSLATIVFSTVVGFLMDNISFKALYVVGGIAVALSLLFIILYRYLYEKREVGVSVEV